MVRRLLERLAAARTEEEVAEAFLGHFLGEEVVKQVEAVKTARRRESP
jgi:hypothetical protein